jgi:hypothetical protein
MVAIGSEDYVAARNRKSCKALLHLLELHHGAEEVASQPVEVIEPEPIPAPPVELPNGSVPAFNAFQAWIDKFEPLPAPTYPTIHKIKRCVSEHFGITVPEIDSDRRMKRVVRPRQIAMYITKKLTPRSLPDIGRKFGGKDHSTVHHAVHKIENLVEHDAGFAGEISILMAKVQT